MTQLQTLSVLVENKPGVLTRVAALFARRAYNIKSLAVGETEDPRVSRMTIIVEDKDLIEQMVKQLNKLINVIKVVELDENAVLRRLVLLKVNASPEQRGHILDVVNVFRAHVVDVHANHLTIEAVGSLQKLEALQSALEPFGIKEIVQSGAVAISRGSSLNLEQPKEK